MTVMTGDHLEAPSTLGTFLKTLRGRIPPDAAALGRYQRLPARRGRRVTQEEIAELVGVTRGWYRLLESGASVRASVKLLDRLAQALVLTADERLMLFTLAIPEMRQLMR